MQNDMDATQAAEETSSTSENNSNSAMTVDCGDEATPEAMRTDTPPSSSSTSPVSSPSPSAPMAALPTLHQNKKSPTPDCSSTSSESTESDANVEQVVAKSKRAASFLWMLLHAQHCPAVVDAKDVNRNSNESNNSTCSLRGCKQVKRLLLHIKTCPAKNSPSAPCPCNYQGCQDARKLLAHYKQCRENARAQRKQSRIMMNNKLKGKQQQQQQTNFCLICTLLARHDKEMTERLRRKKHEQQQRRQQMHSIAETDSSTEAAAIALTTMFTSSYAKSPTTSSHNSYNSQTHTKTVQFNLNANTDENSLSDPHMPPPAPRTRSRTSSMGSISSLLRAAKVKNKRPINSRPRAGSLDERRSLSSLSSSNIYLPNDPTLELELIKPTTTFDIPNHESNLDHSGNTQSDGVPFRKRSVSCSSTVSESPSRRFCDTIMEE